MGGLIDALLQWMVQLPALLVYAVLAFFAAIENVFPPVPADVVALFGGFIAGQGGADPWTAFLVVWFANVGGALGVYAVGRRYGTAFFSKGFGRMLLDQDQMERLAAVYRRHGVVVIFISRFLPMFRAVVPIFAGTSGVPVVRAALPIAVASGAWYGLIIYLGATAGANWDRIRATVETSGRWLAITAALLGVAVAWWWWHSRRPRA